MAIFQLIYASQPFGFDDAMLGGILVQARRNNARDGVTGCLIARADLYLQMLEGEAAAIETLYGKIVADDRHLQAERLWSGTAQTRLFPDWAMRDDPARSWLWSIDEVADGALQRASADELQAVFARIAA
ncbi:MAG: BLUF domain-containing protein [Sphingomonadaceae bacterium]